MSHPSHTRTPARRKCTCTSTAHSMQSGQSFRRAVRWSARDLWTRENAVVSWRGINRRLLTAVLIQLTAAVCNPRRLWASLDFLSREKKGPVHYKMPFLQRCWIPGSRSHPTYRSWFVKEVPTTECGTKRWGLGGNEKETGRRGGRSRKRGEMRWTWKAKCRLEFFGQLSCLFPYFAHGSPGGLIGLHAKPLARVERIIVGTVRLSPSPPAKNTQASNKDKRHQSTCINPPPAPPPIGMGRSLQTNPQNVSANKISAEKLAPRPHVGQWTAPPLPNKSTLLLAMCSSKADLRLQPPPPPTTQHHQHTIKKDISGGRYSESCRQMRISPFCRA